MQSACSADLNWQALRGQVRKVVYQLCDAYIDVGGFVLTNADGWTGEEGAGAEGRA